MKITYYPYTIQFRYPFRIAHGVRDTTPVVFIEAEENGACGFGEAALPPYLPDTTQSVIEFLSGIDLSRHRMSMGVDTIMEEINHLFPGNYPAKAALDIALHDLYGKVNGCSLKKIFRTENLPAVFSTYTFGMSESSELRKKFSDACDFRIFKLKLSGKNDKQRVEEFLSEMKNNIISKETGSFPEFCVDVNQGWADFSSLRCTDKTKTYALEMAYMLSEKGALFIEQPFPKGRLKETAWLADRSPVPIIADEELQVIADLEEIKNVYSGINIKLVKCGGLIQAKKIMDRAKELEMKILIGCMSESSCAVTAAAHLSPFADWADLDGPYLIKNDPFTGMKIKEGKIVLPGGNGLGVVKR